MTTFKLTSPMMHGSGVVRLQELLDGLGFDGGLNDGIYGPDTAKAVHDFQRSAGLVTDGICGPKTWRAILDKTDELRDDGSTDDGIIIDRRGMHKRPRLYGYEREIPRIDSVVLHQTGCNMPSKPSGWDRLNAHIGITQEGKAIIVNDFGDMIWHAQGLSKRSIGIEIEGNFYGIEGKKSTWWKPGGGPNHLNPAMMKALDAVYEYLYNWMYKYTVDWKNVFAHRQSSKMRANDPGEEIWRAVAIPWIKKIGAAKDRTDFKTGSGKPIPKQWTE